MQTVLITVDALRADHLSQYGYNRNTLPAADRIESRGITYERAFANGAFTRVSVPSFLTSSYMAYEDIEAYPTIPDMLDANVETAVVGTQTGIGLVGGEFGFDKHIDLGRDDFSEENSSMTTEVAREVGQTVNDALTRVGASRLREVLKKPYKRIFGDAVFPQLGYTPAPEVTDAALDWVKENKDEPFFLWVHYMEPHRPYGVHDKDPEFIERVSEKEIRHLMREAGLHPDSVSSDTREQLVDMYDSDIKYCSRSLERLFDGLQEAGVFEEAGVILTSDHGEEFGEHGRFFHRNYTYEELIHVPLFVSPPRFTETSSVGDVRELLDIAPTIADWHGASYDAFNGVPLDSSKRREVISLGQPPYSDAACSIRNDSWKLIVGESTELLFDLQADPQEQNDVSEKNQDVVEELRKSIPEHVIKRAVKPPRSPDDDIDKERLRALGYMEVREE